jgi:polysaccharide export outer membrane protein
MRVRWKVRTLSILVAIVAGLMALVARDLRRSQMIQPPDLIDVEVKSALPERPIKGERLVRPDGKISLGYYGEVYVAGLTPDEARAKVVVHLREFLSDEQLGLVQSQSTVDAAGRPLDGRRVSPYETDHVSVRVTTKNSPMGLIDRVVAVFQRRF